MKGASTTEDVLSIMERTSIQIKKQGNFSHLPVVGKPMKPVIGKPLTVPKQKPITATEPVVLATPTAKEEDLSNLVNGMSEEARKQEALKFEQTRAENVQKMEDIKSQIRQAHTGSAQNQNDFDDEDCADELNDIMEQSLM